MSGDYAERGKFSPHSGEVAASSHDLEDYQQMTLVNQRGTLTAEGKPVLCPNCGCEVEIELVYIFADTGSKKYRQSCACVAPRVD